MKKKTTKRKTNKKTLNNYYSEFLNQITTMFKINEHSTCLLFRFPALLTA